jgi:putative lipoprotein
MDRLVAWFGVGVAGMIGVTACLLLAGCQSPEKDGASSISAPARAGELRGTVNFRQATMLVPGMAVEVKLVDASRGDGSGETLGATTIREPRNLPVPFVLNYEPARIDPRRRYEVQARVMVDGRVRWINTTAYPVLTGAGGGGSAGRTDNIEVWVEQVSRR